MTKDHYERIVGIDNLARWEAMAASKNMTGLQLAELMAAKAAQTFDDLDGSLGAPRNAVAQVSGNVIQVNFSARAAASWGSRNSHQKPSKRRNFANRVSIMPMLVPSTSPNPTSTAVPSTSLDTGFPYSGR